VGNCASALNCTAPVNGSIDADGDIVGDGVRLVQHDFHSRYLSCSIKALVAFLATALGTIGAVIFGYLSDSLPKSYLNDFDAAVIAAYQKMWFSTKFVPWLIHTMRMLFHILRHPFGSEALQPRPDLPREVREEALIRFMVVLSDQQLVTGLAILLGCVANQCTITGYEFSVVTSLAWFSSTTHLATLDVLRDYFRAHTVLRNWRIFGMVALLLILAYTVVVGALIQLNYQSTPIQCFFSSAPVAGGSLDPLDPFSWAMTILTIGTLFFLYANRIRYLYGNRNEVYWRLWKVRARNYHYWRPCSQVLAGVDEVEEAFNEAISVYQSSSRLDYLQKLHETHTWTRPLLLAWYLYKNSFLSSTSELAFSVSYGISQLVDNRWIYSPPLSTGSTSMGFGQITPIFLLILPLFAAAEIYYGK
jgi:hypothetical protein